MTPANYALMLAGCVSSQQPVGSSGMSDDYALMLDNLTATQARCTELLEENRRLKAELQASKACSCRYETVAGNGRIFTGEVVKEEVK